jgi:hypothetical protein
MLYNLFSKLSLSILFYSKHLISLSINSYKFYLPIPQDNTSFNMILQFLNLQILKFPKKLLVKFFSELYVSFKDFIISFILLSANHSPGSLLCSSNPTSTIF